MGRGTLERTPQRYRPQYAVSAESKTVYQNKIHRARKRNQRISLVVELLGTMLLVWLAFGMIFGLAVVRGDSMLPSYHNGDLLFISRLATPRAGDVILFHKDGTEYIKRVIAGPGDQVDLDESTGTVLVNGTPRQEAYVVSPTLPWEGGLEFPVVLGEGEYFVLGDNRPYSQDSRQIGLIQREQIDGKVLAQLRLAISK